MSVAAVLLALVPSLVSAGPGPLTPTEVALLLELGVTESEILSASARFGGFEAADPEGLRMIRDAGGSEAFAEQVGVARPTIERLASLARRYDVRSVPEAGITFLQPTGWTMIKSAAGDGLVVRTSPEPGGAMFAHPALFLFVQESTGLVPEAGAAVGEKVRDMILDRLEAARLKPREGDAATVELFGGKAEVRTVRATGADGAVTGEIGVAVRIEDNGRAIGVGYAAGNDDLPTTRAHFADFAKTLTVDRRRDESSSRPARVSSAPR